MVRRLRLGGLAVLLLLAAIGPAAARSRPLASVDRPIAGLVPPLSLRMKDVETGKTVTAADFRGKVVMLFFGYTNCGDECPFTQYRVEQVFKTLGPLASHVVFLFVTVDPYRDTPQVLRYYIGLFGPHMVGLRGTPNQLFRLARRYRVVFSVQRSKNPAHYTVTHSAAIYVFGAHGDARFMITKLGVALKPDIAGIAHDLRTLIRHTQRSVAR
ncbi:SCO family protein [Acidiphilium iwatense]|nr:SCO family protein [Acidiphilium iwatense]